MRSGIVIGRLRHYRAPVCRGAAVVVCVGSCGPADYGVQAIERLVSPFGSISSAITLIMSPGSSTSSTESSRRLLSFRPHRHVQVTAVRGFECRVEWGSRRIQVRVSPVTQKRS